MPSTLEKVKHDLTELSVKEIGELIEHAQALHVQKREEEKASFLDEVRQMAEERGLDLVDVLGGGPASRGKTAPAPRATGKAPPKYRNPENPDQVWSGRGRAPAWAAPYKEAGDLEEIAIK